MKLNGKKIDSVCKFNGYDVIYEGGFSGLTAPFEGEIQLFFRMQNPKDNQFIRLVAFKIIVFDDSNMNYGIDKLENLLFPNIGCEYPCKTCAPSDRTHCWSCLPQLTAPQFLHASGVDKSTCIDKCPPGYTSNGSRNPRKCMKCHETCETCQNNDEEGDVNKCLECKSSFPFYWIQKQSCHSNGCPNESYLNNTRLCSSCEKPCKYCSDR